MTVHSFARGKLPRQNMMNDVRLFSKPRQKSPNSEQNVSTPSVRHVTEREMPLPIYIGLELHSVTRMKKLLDKFHKLRMCISYDRVMQIENKTTNSVYEQTRLEDLVCLPISKKGLFRSH